MTRYNEKYKGDAKLQKSFTLDFLTKKKKINEGEIPQYYVQNSHPAIISPEVFDIAQNEMKKRKDTGLRQSGVSCFSSKIICGQCGGFYGSKVWHSTSKYRRTIWQCNNKFKNGTRCETPHLYEDTLKQAFVDAFNSLIENKHKIISEYEEIIQTLMDNTALDAECTKLQSECDVIAELTRKCVAENAHTALDQEEYNRRYGSLMERYNAIKCRLDQIADEKRERTTRRENINRFLRTLEQNNFLITEFNDELWCAVIDNVIVHSEHDITFKFKDGMELSWKI